MLTRWFAAPKCSHPENAIQPSIVVLRVPSSFIDYTKTSSSLREIRLTRERERDIREWNNDVASIFWKPRTIETLRRAESSATEEQTAAVAAADNRSRQVPPIANYGTRRPRLMYSTSLFFVACVVTRGKSDIPYSSEHQVQKTGNFSLSHIRFSDSTIVSSISHCSRW